MADRRSWAEWAVMCAVAVPLLFVAAVLVTTAPIWLPLLVLGDWWAGRQAHRMARGW